MSMNLQAQAVSGFQAQAAAAALFSPALAPHLLAQAGQRDELAAGARIDTRLDVPLSELTFRHLKTAEEISGIAHLRKEIQLVASGVADPTFVAREKKETTRAL